MGDFADDASNDWGGYFEYLEEQEKSMRVFEEEMNEYPGLFDDDD